MKRTLILAVCAVALAGCTEEPEEQSYYDVNTGTWTTHKPEEPRASAPSEEPRRTEHLGGKSRPGRGLGGKSPGGSMGGSSQVGKPLAESTLGAKPLGGSTLGGGAGGGGGRQKSGLGMPGLGGKSIGERLKR